MRFAYHVCQMLQCLCGCSCMSAGQLGPLRTAKFSALRGTDRGSGCLHGNVVSIFFVYLLFVQIVDSDTDPEGKSTVIGVRIL